MTLLGPSLLMWPLDAQASGYTLPLDPEWVGLGVAVAVAPTSDARKTRKRPVVTVFQTDRRVPGLMHAHG